MPTIKPRIAGGGKSRMAVPPLSVKEFYEKRLRLLILRQTGGLGDILMHRMMFEDFKLLAPDIKIVFACPITYWDAVKDHPYIDEIIDSNNCEAKDFIISYCTTTACGRYEHRISSQAFDNPALPFQDKHRSDIWAEHCGVKLTRHNMHIKLTDDEILFGHKEIRRFNKTKFPTVIFCPMSAMEGKNLDRVQINGTIRELNKMGYYVACLHNFGISELEDAPLMTGYNIRQWMGILYAADFVLSVDTSAFHFAGGVGKPLTGIFSWCDGIVYGKYYKFELVQKHRSYDPCWTCGPCFNWSRCTKDSSPDPRKPCIKEVTVDDILNGAIRMFNRWPINAQRTSQAITAVTK